MARRKRGTIEDFLDLANASPVFGLIAAIALGIGGLLLRFVWPEAIYVAAPIVAKVVWLLAGLALLAASIGWITGQQRQRKFRAQQSLEDIKGLTWQEFEQFIADLFRRQHFRVDEVGGQSDGGVDLRLRAENGDMHLVQCKQYRTWKVGAPKIREFYGAMAASKTRCEGIFVTCGEFTRDAQKFATRKPIRLIDGDALIRMVQAVNQVAPVVDTMLCVPDLASPDPLCPRCRVPMVKRVARKGPASGQIFYGCRNFPRCREIVDVA